VLLRALCGNDPEHAEARRMAMDALTQQPAWFEGLGAFPALQALAGRRAEDPMDVVEDQAQRALLAQALLAETTPPAPEHVQDTVDELRYAWIDRQFREVEEQIKDANRRGDFAEEQRLAQKRLILNRERRGR